MDNNFLVLILTGFGGGAISGLIAYFASRNVNTANAARTITAAATELVKPLRAQIEEFKEQTEQFKKSVYDLECEIVGLKREIVDLKNENIVSRTQNIELKKRVKYLEDILKKNGLAHLLKRFDDAKD